MERETLARLVDILPDSSVILPVLAIPGLVILQSASVKGEGMLLWENRRTGTRWQVAFKKTDNTYSDHYPVTCVCHENCLFHPRHVLTLAVEEVCRANGINDLLVRRSDKWTGTTVNAFEAGGRPDIRHRYPFISIESSNL